MIILFCCSVTVYVTSSLFFLIVIVSSLSFKYDTEFNIMSVLLYKLTVYIVYPFICIGISIANNSFENTTSLDVLLSSIFFVAIAATVEVFSSPSFSVLVAEFCESADRFSDRFHTILAMHAFDFHDWHLTLLCMSIKNRLS